MSEIREEFYDGPEGEDQFRVTLSYSEEHENPREEWDHLGTLVLWDGTGLGDENVSSVVDRLDESCGLWYETDERDEVFQHYTPKDAAIVIPVNFHEERGTARWWECEPEDAKGLIYVTFKKMRDEYKGFIATDEDLTNRAREVLTRELAELSAWASGEVYAWTVEDTMSGEIESCCGYIGDEDYAWSEAMDALKYLSREAAVRMWEDLESGAPMFVASDAPADLLRRRSLV